MQTHDEQYITLATDVRPVGMNAGLWELAGTRSELLTSGTETPRVVTPGGRDHTEDPAVRR